MAAYLQAALEDADPALVIHALGNIARRTGMSQIARKTGLSSREPLQGILSRRESGVCNGSQGGSGIGIKLSAEPRHAP